MVKKILLETGYASRFEFEDIISACIELMNCGVFDRVCFSMNYTNQVKELSLHILEDEEDE